jgi:hypothetical protein
VAYLQDRAIDGQPRTSRRDSTYDTCPSPPMADTRLVILTYVKQNPIQAVQGQLFGMSQSNANTWIHLLHAVLSRALAHQELLPARNADDLAVMLAAIRMEGVPLPPLFGMMALSDRSIAQPIQRNSRTTTEVRRSVTRSKTRLIIDETCRICFLSDTVEGKEDDKSLTDLAGYTLPRGSHLYQDMGFQGFMLDGITIIQPKKKPRGGELIPPKQAHNRVISSIRIRIEHAIGGVKRYRMMKDKIRLLKDGIRDTIMETYCGLHNFRLQYRPWHYAK